MQNIFLIIIGLFSTITMSYAGSHHDHPSIHGMLMVGTKKIYLSHLPMFHSPHDYQAILEVKLSDDALEKYLDSKQTSNQLVYTLVPEIFVLPEMVKNPKPFKAKIYHGHFERGGKIIANNVNIEIQNVIYFKKFSPNEQKPKLGKFIAFGNIEEQFLAHAIVSRPDFDQVTKIQNNNDLAQILSDKNFAQLTGTNILNSTPLTQSSEVIFQTLNENHELALSLQVESMIYLESGDLSH